MPDLPQLDQFDFHARLGEMSGVVLVMFGSPDCGGCRHLRGVLRDLRRYRSSWRVFEVDAQRDPALIHEFEVFHLPTLFLYFDGEFHCELQAPARTAAILEAAEEALCRPAEEAP